MTQHQPYDHALKSLMSDHAAEIIPQLLSDTEVIREQNVEIKRELLRADLVYLVNYRGEAHTLNLELQTNADEDMALRMLRYHVELLIAYRLPVLSVVLYLFEANVPEPPFRETSGSQKEELLTLRYHVLTLWTLDARDYVEKRLIVMYTFLPAMKGANASLLIQALEEMKHHYTQPEFVRHTSRFRTILNRSNTIDAQDKRIVEDYMEYHYDSLLDEDPEIKEKIAQGKLQGELQGAQTIVVTFLEARFPSLAELGQQKVTLIRSKDILSLLAKQIATAPDESTARWLLDTIAA